MQMLSYLPQEGKTENSIEINLKHRKLTNLNSISDAKKSVHGSGARSTIQSKNTKTISNISKSFHKKRRMIKFEINDKLRKN